MAWVPFASSRLQTALVSTLAMSLTISLVEEDDAHAIRPHGVDAGIAEGVGLDLVLGEVGHDLAGVELALRDTDDACALAAGITQSSVSENIGISVDFEAVALECGFKALEFGREDAILELHRCRGVLHGVVIDDDELLDV